MRWAGILRPLLRLVLGRRLPITTSELVVPGIERAVQITRDQWGIPHIRAGSDGDAWFALGFCHGQDRAFELEGLLRIGRGTLAELLGAKALAADRIARRIGFYASSIRQLPALSESSRTLLHAYTAGINSGVNQGLPKKPHEFALLGGAPTPWTPADVMCFVKTLSFLLVANWDAELVRLQVTMSDGPNAAFELDPLSRPESRAAPVAAMEQLQKELGELRAALGGSGGSNNWVISARRTATGRPMLANDPHLFPFLPSQWYLAHLKTPEWEAAGATLIGAPAVALGHNGFAAWGATAGLVDNTDFFIEQIGPDGRSVREANGFQPCTIRRETILVKGAPPVIEEILETPRGPIISPALSCTGPALSLRAVWLEPLPVRGLLEVHRCRSLDSFRECFRQWPCLSLNMVYADLTGQIAWQLVGQTPIRRAGTGLTPLPAWLPHVGWEPDCVPFEQMPHAIDPECGYVATANNHPDPDGLGPHLGHDFLDSYRRDAIVEHLAARTDWNLAAVQQLQMNVLSLPWRQLRATVLRCTPPDKPGIVAWQILRDWDGHVREESAGAAVFELFVAELTQRLAKSKAPHSFAWELGRRACMPGNNLFSCRRLHHLVSVLREQPVGWFASWPDEICAALSRAAGTLMQRSGSDPRRWRWGHLRRLTLRHPLLQNVPVLRSLFNEGRIPIGGDGDTIMQAATVLTDPCADTDNIPGLRLVIDVGNWSASRFVIAGGQSGNPLSPHFLDLLPLWQRGEGVPIAWTADEVAAASREVLTLSPLVSR